MKIRCLKYYYRRWQQKGPHFHRLNPPNISSEKSGILIPKLTDYISHLSHIFLDKYSCNSTFITTQKNLLLYYKPKL